MMLFMGRRPDPSLAPAQCEGKVAFDTWSLAHAVAGRRGKKGRKSTAYKCPHCRKFHLGTPKRLNLKRRNH